jgi:hypothetical protein
MDELEEMKARMVVAGQAFRHASEALEEALQAMAEAAAAHERALKAQTEVNWALQEAARVFAGEE